MGGHIDTWEWTSPDNSLAIYTLASWVWRVDGGKLSCKVHRLGLPLISPWTLFYFLQAWEPLKSLQTKQTNNVAAAWQVPLIYFTPVREQQWRIVFSPLAQVYNHTAQLHVVLPSPRIKDQSHPFISALSTAVTNAQWTPIRLSPTCCWCVPIISKWP